MFHPSFCSQSTFLYCIKIHCRCFIGDCFRPPSYSSTAVNLFLIIKFPVLVSSVSNKCRFFLKSFRFLGRNWCSWWIFGTLICAITVQPQCFELLFWKELFWKELFWKELFWKELLLKGALTERSSYWKELLLKGALTERSSYWKVLLLKGALTERCSYWKELLLKGALTERCSSERCSSERCSSERCSSERCSSERCSSERCSSERSSSLTSSFKISNVSSLISTIKGRVCGYIGLLQVKSWPLFLNCINMMIVATWRVYVALKRGLVYDLLAFTREVVTGLLTTGSKRNLPGPSRRRIVDKQKGLHHPTNGESQGRCKFCMKNTVKKCKECGVRLHPHCFLRKNTQYVRNNHFLKHSVYTIHYSNMYKKIQHFKPLSHVIYFWWLCIVIIGK